MMNNQRFYNFPRITVALYFMEFESIIVYRGTGRARCLCEKAYNFRIREFSLVKLLLVRCSNTCLRLFVQDYRDFIIGALHFTSIPISTFGGYSDACTM